MRYHQLSDKSVAEVRREKRKPTGFQPNPSNKTVQPWEDRRPLKSQDTFHPDSDQSWDGDRCRAVKSPLNDQPGRDGFRNSHAPTICGLRIFKSLQESENGIDFSVLKSRDIDRCRP